MIRLTIPSLEEDDLQAVCEVLLSGYLVQGQRVADFERQVAQYVGVDHAVAVSNCTAALHLALLAHDVGQGDLVCVTAYSWPATANVIELCGAQPVFVDIQPDTFNMDPACLEVTLRRLMDTPGTPHRVKAILPVHAFGQMADMPAILELAMRHGLPVIEDAACALGAALHGKQAGAWGAMGCFSFHPRKAITTGEGGIITTNDAVSAWRLRVLRNHGQDPNAATPDFVLPGFNYRMTEFQAALGCTQMTKLERIIAVRRRLAARYDAMLENTSFQRLQVPQDCQAVYQSYVILLPDAIAERRSELIRQLKDQGVETTIGTWHMPLTTFFRTRYGYRVGDFPVTDGIFARALTLPLHEYLREDEQDRVVNLLLEALSEKGKGRQ